MKCYCNSGKNYPQCCGQYIDEAVLPITPEQLMRSRYSAFSQGKVDYIVNTMCGKAAKRFNAKAAQGWSGNNIWKKLEIVHTYLADDDPNTGFVEFKAHYQINGQTGVQHELSEFKKIDSKWFYSDGKLY